MGIEIVEQLGWQMPDVILYPTGGGVGLIGIHKALLELIELGWVSGKLPRLVAVQAEGCAPIVKAWEEKKERSDFWNDSKTIAFGINVPKALGDFLVLRALYDTNGAAVAVSDEELLQEQSKVAQLEGAFICPEGAAAFAAARKLTQAGWIKRGEKVVVLNTGAGIKYPDTVQVNPPILNIGDTISS
jgi:threonine synthase